MALLYYILWFFVPNNYVNQDIEISNLKYEMSAIHMALYTAAEDFPDHPIKTFTYDYLANGNLNCNLTEINEGKYFIAVFQDLDGNDKLNKNFFGLPTEPYGFSKNVKPNLLWPCRLPCCPSACRFFRRDRSGWPHFQRAQSVRHQGHRGQ